MPPDHAGAHPMNANPFNFYGVDYWISNPGINPDFQSLKTKYEDLVKKIEILLSYGLNPYETLLALENDVCGNISNTTKKEIDSTFEY